MKMRPDFMLYGALLCAGADPFAVAAAPSGQVDACVEVYELGQASANAFKTAFDAASGAARDGMLLQLRSGTLAGGVRTVAVGHRPCLMGKRTYVASTKDYVYPTSFEAGAKGHFYPSAFAKTAMGCEMVLEMSPGNKDGTFAVNAGITDVERLSPKRDDDLKPDAKGQAVKPVFNTSEIKTKVEMTAGVSQILGTYAPYKDNTAMRLVILTVYPGQ